MEMISAGFFMPMSTQIPYDRCLETMFSLRRFGIKLGLSTIRGILDGLGSPENSYRCIHIAGTNGKGSIAATLASILEQAGARVGLYTSPHLIRFNERISINGHPIGNDEVVAAFRAVRGVRSGDREPTFFEFATAMALYEFARQKVDWAIIETGMGGRLDATNVVRPSVSVISNISLEHKSYLGNTIGEIAGEKGGIIKQGVPVVTGVRQKSAREVVRDIARKRSAPFYRLGEHFRYRTVAGGCFNYYGISHTWRGLRPGLNGTFQTENAALAAAVCEVLTDTGMIAIPPAAVRAGFSTVNWPGRLEKVSTSPLVILDGAHNLAAARNLGTFLKNEFTDRCVTLVAGILDDKPYEAMLKSILPHCGRAILTRPKIDRALSPATLETVAGRMVPAVDIVEDVGEALRKALKTAEPDEVVCVAGSLYVVGEAMAWLERESLRG